LNYSGTFFFSSSLKHQCAAGSLFAVAVTPKNETAGKHFCCYVPAIHFSSLADLSQCCMWSVLPSGQPSRLCMART